MKKTKASHDTLNQILKLKTILELINSNDLPLKKSDVFKEVEKSLSNIRSLYKKLLT